MWFGTAVRTLCCQCQQSSGVAYHISFHHCMRPVAQLGVSFCESLCWTFAISTSRCTYLIRKAKFVGQVVLFKNQPYIHMLHARDLGAGGAEVALLVTRTLTTASLGASTPPLVQTPQGLPRYNGDHIATSTLGALR